MEQILSFALTLAEAVGPHWPWVSILVVLSVFTQVMKTSVFTKKKAYTKGKMQSFWWWGWKLLALIPITLGALIGYFWNEPEPGITGMAAVMYSASAGACSVAMYQVLKGLAKKRNIDLTLPGQSITPSDPEQD